MSLKSILESLIFASDRPITIKQLRALTNTARDEAITQALEDLEAEYRDSGIQLTETGGGYQFRTHPDNATWVKKLLAGRPPRLTRAMLETLAIVAYRQPITRPEIEDIRGVDSGGVLRILLERGLIRIMGKKEEVGRPILYGSTRQFLEFFNLKDLRELPTLKEFTELSEEHADRVENQFGEGESDAPTEGDPTAEAPVDASPDAAVAAVDDADVLASPEGDSPQDRVDGDDAEDPSGDVTFPAAVATPDTHVAEGAEPPDTFPAAMKRPQTLAELDEEDDAALLALDRALERVDTMLKAQRSGYQPAPAEESEEGLEPETDPGPEPDPAEMEPEMEPEPELELEPEPELELELEAEPEPEPDPVVVLDMDPPPPEDDEPHA